MRARRERGGPTQPSPAKAMIGHQEENGTRQSRALPSVTFAFWITKFLVTAPGWIIGQSINQWVSVPIWPTIAALICVAFAGAAACRLASSRLAQAGFWGATFGICVLTTTLAERIDVTLGIGDLPASLHLAVLLLVCLVLDYRMIGTVALLPYGSRQEPFFWSLALLAQMLASAVTDSVVDPGGLGLGLGWGVVAGAALMTSLLYYFGPAWRVFLFWLSFVLAGSAGALTGATLVSAHSVIIR